MRTTWKGLHILRQGECSLKIMRKSHALHEKVDIKSILGVLECDLRTFDFMEAFLADPNQSPERFRSAA